jgi:hypothetical protein
LVETGKPEILVRDAFAPNLATSGAAFERPKKIIVANSGEFSLQFFSRFYRVYDAATGELVLERTGINPNFSPSSRFICAFADGRLSISILGRPSSPAERSVAAVGTREPLMSRPGAATMPS